MEYTQLGNSGLNVSTLAFGAWQIGDDDYWGPAEHADADAVVKAALDGGINLFDTAELYGAGASERALGKALGSRRKDVYIASKVAPEHCAPDQLRASCEASLTHLGTDYLDLYQVHWPCRDVPFADTYAELRRLKDEGKIRNIGVSNFGPNDMINWCEAGEMASNQLGYNLLFRAIEFEILPACRKLGAGVLAYMPLMQGILAGRWHAVEDIPTPRRRTRHFSGGREGTRHGEEGCEELLIKTLDELRQLAEETGHTLPALSIAWVIAQPGVSATVIGARNPAQLERNLRLAQVEPEVLATVSKITAPLKERMGPDPDLWEGAAKTRSR